MSLNRICSIAIATASLVLGSVAWANGEPIDSPFNGGDVTQPDDGIGGDSTDPGCGNDNGGSDIDNPSYPGDTDGGEIDDPGFPGGDDNGGI